MKPTNIPFSIEASDARIRSILDAPEGCLRDAQRIPAAERLTYGNGFYVECAAVFIDIRGSSALTAKNSEAELGKIYRAYISECVAVMNQDPNCREIFIQGDCVGAVFHAPRDEDVDSVLLRAGELNSLIERLNWRLSERGYAPLKCGIGVSAGRALMIQAGYKGSGINEVIWMGNVVNEAAKLCLLGNRGQNLPTQVSSSAFARLNAKNRRLLRSASIGVMGPFHYQGNLVSTEMSDWTAEQKGNKPTMLSRLISSMKQDTDPGPLRSVSWWS